MTRSTPERRAVWSCQSAQMAVWGSGASNAMVASSASPRRISWRASAVLRITGQMGHAEFLELDLADEVTAGNRFR